MKTSSQLTDPELNGDRTVSDVPEGWATTTIGVVAEINPPKPSQKALSPGAPVTFVPMPAVDARMGSIVSPETRNFTSVRKGYTSFLENDVLFAKITPCMENGKVAIARNLANGLGFGSTEFLVLRSKGAILPEYLFYYLRQEWFRRTAEAEMTGSVGQRRVPAGFLGNAPLPLAPEAEQKRIVAKAEVLIARVNATKERLAKVTVILKRFRQAVLAAACSGRLTNAWREQNVPKETGQDLLNHVLEEREIYASKNRSKKDCATSPAIEELADLPLSWAWSTVGQIARNFDGRRIPVKADDRTKRKGTSPYYGASGIIDTIDEYLFDGDYLLIAEDGANLLSRSTPIAFRANGKFWVNNHAHIIQSYAGIPLAYLEGYLNAIDLQHYITGSAQPKLTQEAMNRIPVPVPPIGEEHEIVRRVATLLKLAYSIEKRLTVATSRANKLTQAILAKAFRGELVPTEAELARCAGRSYESAPTLLARIKAELAEKGTNLKPAGRSALKSHPKKVLTKSIN